MTLDKIPYCVIRLFDLQDQFANRPRYWTQRLSLPVGSAIAWKLDVFMQADEELDRPPAHCGTGFACSFVCGFICGEASAIPRRNQRWRW